MCRNANSGPAHQKHMLETLRYYLGYAHREGITISSITVDPISFSLISNGTNQVCIKDLNGKTVMIVKEKV